MSYQIIDVHDGSTSESWLCVHSDGRIELHVENNGPRILRYGVEAIDKPITMIEVEQLDRRHPGKRLVERVREILAEFGAD